MNRLFRVCVLVMLAAFALVAPAAFAQDNTFGLSDSDFALWTQALENSASFETLTLDYTSTLNAVGLGDAPASWDVSGQAWISTAGAFAMTAVGTVSNGTETLDANMEVRIVGDMIFVSFDGGETWQGGPLNDVVDGAGLPVDPADLASGDLSGIMGDDAMMGAMAGLGSLNPADFISMTAGANGGLTTIAIDVSIADLLATPALGGLLGGAMGGGAEMSEEEQAQMGMMFSMIFADAVLSYTQSIDPATSLVEEGAFVFSLPLSAMGMGEDAVLELGLNLDFTEYNGPVVVEAPASFEPLEMGAMAGA